MAQRHAAERVRLRILEWLKKRGHGGRTELADAVPSLYGDTKSRSWVTDILRGPPDGADLRLRDLDHVAALLGVPPGDLVRRDHDHYLEVSTAERRLIEFYRSLPDHPRQHLSSYFDYIFAMQRRLLDQQAQERDERTREAKRLYAESKRKPQLTEPVK